jgi:hypothetical protein
LEEDEDDEDEDGGALFLDFGGGGGGREGALEDGGSSERSRGICDAHLENLSSPISPSSSSSLIDSVIPLNHLDCSANFLSIDSSASFICSFIHFLKISFSFWCALSLCSFSTCSVKGLALGCSAQTTSLICSIVRA